MFSELEWTAAEIRRLVSAKACRYREITVAARNMGDYEGVVETVFRRYGIPAYLSRRTDILEKPVMSLLSGVLASIGGGYEYDDMFRWLKTGLAGLAPEECDELENYVLKWEVHGGMWLRDVDWAENPDGYGAPWTPGAGGPARQGQRPAPPGPGPPLPPGGGPENRRNRRRQGGGPL